MRTCTALALLTLAALALLGCGGGKGAATTPEGTAAALVAAMQAGDALAVASLYDFTDSARRENENWDDIPAGQRDLILKEEAKRKAASLEAGVAQAAAQWKDAQVGAAQVSGDTATVTINLGTAPCTISLVQREGKWYLAGGVVQ